MELRAHLELPNFDAVDKYLKYLEEQDKNETMLNEILEKRIITFDTI